MPTLFEKQAEMCRRNGANFHPVADDLKVGVSRNVLTGEMPINGLRHRPEGDTSGWYIYAGENPSSNDDFFEPLHVSHVGDWCPLALPYLGLPPGWRFLVTPDYEDIWFDPALLAD